MLAVAVSLTSIAAGALGRAPPHAPPPPPSSRPNFVLLVPDDETENAFKPRFQPHVFHWLVDHGTRFPNGLSAPPLCCPDRAGLLTGDYPHNSGVFFDDPGYATLTDKPDTLPAWLQGSGYRTAMIGKLLNKYNAYGGLHPAPGFDYWFNQLGTKRYYDYQVSDQGVRRSYARRRRDYSTDVLTRHAKSFIHQSSRNGRPFYLWLGYDAPHTQHANFVRGCAGNDPIPSDRRAVLRFQHVRLPRPPDFNEADVSDKPSGVSNLPPISSTVFDNIRRRYHCQLAADLAIDHSVARLHRELRRDGELGNTIVFYYSDNGYFFGEHRLARGKALPYEPALRVPFAVHVPSRYRPHPQPRTDTQLVDNEDIAATILDYAGNPPSCAAALDCRTLDGRSMRPLLGGSAKWPRNRAVLAEISGGTKNWRAVRTPNYLYVRYEGGERELYDLRRDPYELHNVAAIKAYAPARERLAKRLERLRHCSGIKGHAQKLNGTPFCD